MIQTLRKTVKEKNCNILGEFKSPVIQRAQFPGLITQIKYY